MHLPTDAFVAKMAEEAINEHGAALAQPLDLRHLSLLTPEAQAFEAGIKTSKEAALNEALAKLKADQEERETACQAAINDALQRYACTLAPSTVITYDGRAPQLIMNVKAV